jgi:hypothetical protein
MLEVEGITYIYWQIHFLSILGFIRVLGVEGVTYIYRKIYYL